MINTFLEIFFLSCQAWENIYMDWKAMMVKQLSITRLDEHLPF